MSSGYQAWLGLPALGIAVAVVLTVIGARLTAPKANLLLAGAWILATISIFYLPFLVRVQFIPRILWTLLFTSIVGLGLYQLRWYETPAPPIALTLRFNLMVRFPFSIPPHTTAYAVLAHAKMKDFWGAREIKNDGSKHLVWPDKKELRWEELTGIPDFAFAVDLTNHSDHKLVNLTMIFDFEFSEGSNREAFKQSNVKVRHTVVIPSLAMNATAKIYIANQSSLGVFVSFPSGATVLVVGESERRRVSLTKTGMNVIEMMPEWVLPRPRVRWKGIPD